MQPHKLFNPSTGLGIHTRLGEDRRRYSLSRLKNLCLHGGITPLLHPGRHSSVSTKKESINTWLYGPHDDETNPARYFKSGQLDYRDLKDHGKPDSMDRMNADINFNIYF